MRKTAVGPFCMIQTASDAKMISERSWSRVQSYTPTAPSIQCVKAKAILIFEGCHTDVTCLLPQVSNIQHVSQHV